MLHLSLSHYCFLYSSCPHIVFAHPFKILLHINFCSTKTNIFSVVGREAKQGRISILKYIQSGKTKRWLLCPRKKVSGKYAFLKSISDSEIRDISDREGSLLTPPWVGRTPVSSLLAGDFVQSSPRPLPQPCIALHVSSIPHSQPASWAFNVCILTQHHAQNGAWFSALLSNIELLNNLSTRSPAFSCCTSQIGQTHKFCSWSCLY